MIHSQFPVVSNGANPSQNIHTKNEFKELPICKKSFLKNNIKLIAAFCFSSLGGSIGGGLLGLAGGIVFTIATGGAGVVAIPFFVILGVIGGGAASGTASIPYIYNTYEKVKENPLTFSPVANIYNSDLKEDDSHLENDDSGSESVANLDDEYFFTEKDIVKNKNSNRFDWW